MPRTQITSAQVDQVSGNVNVGGPLSFDPNEALLNLDVVLVQGATYAYGQTAVRGGLRRPGWSCEAQTTGKFDVTQPAIGLASITFMDVTDATAPLPQKLGWTEVVYLS